MSDVSRAVTHPERILRWFMRTSWCVVLMLSVHSDARASADLMALGSDTWGVLPAQVDERATARRLCLRAHQVRWNRCPGKKYVWSEKRTKCLAASTGLYANCLEKALPSYDPLVRGARCRERAFKERSRKKVHACDRAEKAARQGKRPNWPYSGLW